MRCRGMGSQGEWARRGSEAWRNALSLAISLSSYHSRCFTRCFTRSYSRSALLSLYDFLCSLSESP